MEVLHIKNSVACITLLYKYKAFATLSIVFLVSSATIEATNYDLDWSKLDNDLQSYFHEFEWSDSTLIIDERSVDENGNFINRLSELNIDGDLIICGNISHCYFDMPVTVHGALIVERFIDVAFFEDLLVEGDLVVSGSFHATGKLTVEGDITVLFGDFSHSIADRSFQMRCNSLNVRDGTATVDSISAPLGIIVGRDLYCRGDISSNKGGISVQGDMFVDGNLQCWGKLMASNIFIEGHCLVESEIFAKLGGITVGKDLEAHNSVISMSNIEVGGDILGWGTIAAGIYQVMRNKEYNSGTIRCKRLISGDVISGELIENSLE